MMKTMAALMRIESSRPITEVENVFVVAILEDGGGGANGTTLIGVISGAMAGGNWELEDDQEYSILFELEDPSCCLVVLYDVHQDPSTESSFHLLYNLPIFLTSWSESNLARGIKLNIVLHLKQYISF